jgi:hypothetical protein
MSKDAPHSYEGARKMGEDACERYVRWYDTGPAHEAGAIAYDLVSVIRAMLAALPSSPPEWVPVAERLPEPCQSVALVNIHRWEACGDDMARNVHDVGYLSEVQGQQFWSIRGERAQSVTAFTHWMPLPVPPATHRSEAGND